MRYLVTCLKCGQSTHIKIDQDNIVFFEEGERTCLLSARLRPDGNWGFECCCGNDSRLGEFERQYLDELVSGTPKEIEAIKQSLRVPDKEKFKMVKV